MPLDRKRKGSYFGFFEATTEKSVVKLSLEAWMPGR